LGKPIIAYSIETAIESRLFDEIYVSTDDEEIARISESFGAKSLNRHPELAQNDIGTQQVTCAALYQLSLSGLFPEAVCCLYATSPLLCAEDLERGYKALHGARYCVSVGASPLRDAGAFYFGASEAFLNNEPLYEVKTGLVVIPEGRVCDINIPADWYRAEQMYRALQ
jgi:N-acylneuraminate cytidylyltransferase